jgi:two-component system, chemotaxis family, protein-glutamate methylesterase/glutaminase
MNLMAQVDAIVIGTSAGGVQAMSKLLPALPAGTRAAVIAVLHLSRDHPSLLPEIFQRVCRLPVREAEDKQPVEGGRVYIAPANYHLLVDEGPQLALSADDPVNYSRPSIDVLFESAAEVYGKRLLGIILTGANADGAKGLAAVKDAGGLTVVQTPGSAQAPAMANAALALRPADQVLSLEGIASLLSSLEAA